MYIYVYLYIIMTVTSLCSTVLSPNSVNIFQLIPQWVPVKLMCLFVCLSFLIYLFMVISVDILRSFVRRVDFNWPENIYIFKRILQWTTLKYTNEKKRKTIPFLFKMGLKLAIIVHYTASNSRQRLQPKFTGSKYLSVSIICLFVFQSGLQRDFCYFISVCLVVQGLFWTRINASWLTGYRIVCVTRVIYD